MSVLCSTALTKTVREEALTDTNTILNRTRQIIIERLSTHGEKALRDGMDIALIRLSKTAPNQIQFYGANRPLWIVHNNDLLEIKGDRQPIGYHENIQPFSAHTLNIPENAMLYLATDGYADQPGGPQEKKFGPKKLQTLLTQIAHLEPAHQAAKLAETFEQWRNEINQIDDVTLIGIRVSGKPKETTEGPATALP